MTSAGLLVVVGILLSCWATPHNELMIEVPPGYNGPVEVQLGVAGAPPLARSGGGYVISVPPDGRVSTSTSLSEGQPAFKNVERDRVWGYTSLILRTGDGIAVGGSIEFFVGTKDQYQMEITRKHKSLIIDNDASVIVSSLGLAVGMSF